eukprot:s1878_g4.t1
MGRLLPKYKAHAEDSTPVVAEEPTLALCTNQDGALVIPPEIRTRYLQDAHRAPEWRRILKEFDRKWGCSETSQAQETTSSPGPSAEQPGGVEALPSAATWSDIFAGEPTSRDALNNKYGQGLHTFIIDSNLTAVIDASGNDGSCKPLRDILQEVERSGCVEFELAGHRHERPPSVCQGNEDDRTDDRSPPAKLRRSARLSFENNNGPTAAKAKAKQERRREIENMHDRLPTHSSPSADSDDTLVLPGLDEYPEPGDTQLDDSDANNTPSAAKNLEIEFSQTFDFEATPVDKNNVTPSSPPTSTPGDGIPKTKPASAKGSVKSAKDMVKENGKTSSLSTSTPGDPKTEPAPVRGSVKTSKEDMDKEHVKTSSLSTSTPAGGVPSSQPEEEVKKEVVKPHGSKTEPTAPEPAKGKQPKRRARPKQPAQKPKRKTQSAEEKKRKHRLACDRWHSKWISKGIPRPESDVKAEMAAPSKDPSQRAKAKKADKTKTGTKKKDKEMAKKRDLRSVKGEFIRAFLQKYETSEPETRQSRLGKATKAWMESDERAKLKAKPGSQILL